MQQRDDLLVAQRLQHVDAATGEKRGIQLEGRILCGCADQSNCSSLDVRQKCILLTAIEAVNFIHKQDRAHAGGSGLIGFGHDHA